MGILGRVMRPERSGPMAACVLGESEQREPVGGPGSADRDGAQRPEARTGREPTEPDRMGAPVTPHAEITGAQEATAWTRLGCGVDSLDVGFYGAWDKASWPSFQGKLARGKEAAKDSSGFILFDTCLGPCLIYSKGIGSFGYHLQVAELHLGIDTRPESSSSPNVMVSLKCETLCRYGVSGALQRADKLLAELRYTVKEVKISRCDLRADFLIPGGLSLDRLRESAVCRSRKLRPYLDADKLETAYFGAGGAAIQCRIYDKSTEIMAKGDKLWLFETWGIPVQEHVWRVEMQLRRKALLQFGVSTVSELSAKLGGVWENLTTEWLSLREPGDGNTTRRLVLPWWKAVQETASEFGKVVEIKRDFNPRSKPNREWYVAHIAGCLLTHAALACNDNLDDALVDLETDLLEKFDGRDFLGEYTTKCVKLGLPPGVRHAEP